MDLLRWIFYAAAKQAKLSSKMSKDSFRKDLSMPGLLREMRECFDRVPDLIISRGITLSDCLMTGLAIFCLKIPSMLKYEQLVRLDESTVQAKNLKSLFGVKRPPQTHGYGNALTVLTLAACGAASKLFFPSCSAEMFLRTGPCSMDIT